MASRGRILIADDEKSFLKFSANLFRKEGYLCDCAEDGSEAVNLLRRHRYDVVISDIKMPGNRGLRLAEEVGNIQKGVPVLIVTGYPSMRTAKRAIELPVVGYIEKPVEFTELLSRVNSAIMQKQSRAHDRECRIDRCARLNNIVKEISGAVTDLERTRSSFRSKAVGRIRSRLDAVAKRHGEKD